ncbi:MAG: SDR family oxidoreductase [Ignavibacteriales bacterium]|nr:MAG: SDR family oxidoreductase [Ignavibacteriales bacterium]
MKFEKKVVVITGASSGLGRQLSIDFANEGSSVILFSRDETELKKTFELCNSQHSSMIVGDVSKKTDCINLAEYVKAKYAKADIIVLNAGVSMWTSFDEIDDTDQYRKMFDVNFWGTVNCIKAFSKQLHETAGMVIVISSLQGKIGVPFHTFYSASKHALQGLINSLRFEYHDINFLSVLPHWISGTNLRQNALDSKGSSIGDQKKSHTSESITVEECSKKILYAAVKKKRELIIPFKLKLLIWLYNIYQPLAEKIIRSKVHSQ